MFVIYGYDNNLSLFRVPPSCLLYTKEILKKTKILDKTALFTLMFKQQGFDGFELIGMNAEILMVVLTPIL